MKKAIAILFCACLLLTGTACGSTVVHTQQSETQTSFYVQGETTSTVQSVQATELPATVTESSSTTQSAPAVQPSTTPAVQPPTTPAVQPSTTPAVQPPTTPAVQPPTAPVTDVRALYKQYVQAHPDLYLTYKDTVMDRSTGQEIPQTHGLQQDPYYLFLDLDRDGMEEALLFTRFDYPDFFANSCCMIHIFDYVGGSVTCIFTSGTVAGSRLTEKFEIRRDGDSGYFAIRRYDDGGYSNRVTVYSFADNKMVPKVGYLFDRNFKYWMIGEGKDAFDYYDPAIDEPGSSDWPPAGYIEVSQDELDAAVDAWGQKGVSVFDSLDYS